MDKATMMYYCDLIAVSGRIMNEKQLYNEPWDCTDKDYLLDYVDKMKEALTQRNPSALTEAAHNLAAELTDIIKNEYNNRVYYIRADLSSLKDCITCIDFPSLDDMLTKAQQLENDFPESQPVDFLNHFDEVHRYYYYGGMVRAFINALSSYAQFAEAMGDTESVNQLVELMDKCNGEGLPYVDSHNLYYIAPTADSIINNMLRNF